MGKPQISSEVRLEQMIAKLKNNEFRITPQRYAVLKVLAQSENHPSAERIYEQLVADYPTMSPATVYKTINLLKKNGEILELEFSEMSNRYDGNKPYPHPHMICTKCGVIVDPPVDDFEKLKSKMMEETGFTISSFRLDFFGLCPDCRGK
ncbi:MAG: Fur family transcriptional regulator [Desulfobulbaceae bacterium BRH_c16a]|nr:MAG: Fur family transcriptional regulator [Desulfobulbaceae bacterium BRH_c16a]